MSIKKFSELFEQLDSNKSTNKKINFLTNYFLSNTDLNNIWTINLIIGKSNKRFISGKLLRKYYSDIYGLPLWLVETCYSKVGDSAEVISLLLKEKTNWNNNLKQDISIDKLIKDILPELKNSDQDRRKLLLKNIWEDLSEEYHLVFNKILTGGFRIGVSKGLIIKSLSKMTNIDESIISHRLMGNLEPQIKTYSFLINNKLDLKELSYKPYPFQLANSFEEKIKISESIKNYQFEWKWDGIRSQLIKRSGNVSIWTRGEELVNNSFPELINIISLIKEDFVLDGEILIWDEIKKMPKDFSFLQKRLGRKSTSLKIQTDLPISFIAYDILELNGKDIREEILLNRRKKLESIFQVWERINKSVLSKFQITNLHQVNNWTDVENIKDSSRKNNTEGLIIKNINSKYIAGRKKGSWWKYKVDPMQLDGVLIYAKAGTGKRADLYTDYSFALWDNDKLVKFTSAYTGLTDQEIKKLDSWIRKNTLERYGPVRSVKPELVFEISFDNIQISKRHKSGIAVRFPRITKWRNDKNIIDADTLENARKLLNTKL